MSEAIGVDPRPRVDDAGDDRWLVAGLRCRSCDEVAAYEWPCCPACGGEADGVSFGPEGTVWSSTVVRIPVSDRPPPYALAYVDLDDGPRILAHVGGGPLDRTVAAGSRVRLTRPGRNGDPQIEVL